MVRRLISTSSASDLEMLRCSPTCSTGTDQAAIAPMLSAFFSKSLSGAITLNEFINGCERMKGQAKGIDVHLLLLKCHHIYEKLDRLDALARGTPFQATSRDGIE